MPPNQTLAPTGFVRDYLERQRKACADNSDYGAWQRRYARWLADCFSWRNSDVLDIGCGCGSHVAALVEADVRAIGVDVSEQAIHLGRKRWRSGEWRQESATGASIPFTTEPSLLVGDAVNLHQFWNGQFQGLHTHHCAQYWRPDLVSSTFAELWRVAQPDALYFCVLETSESLARGGRKSPSDYPRDQCIRPLSWWHEQLAKMGWELCTEDYRMELTAHSGSYLHEYDWDWWVARKVSRYEITSKFCVRDDFDRPEHAEWVKRLKLSGALLRAELCGVGRPAHNMSSLKLSGQILRTEWEQTHIAAALAERELLVHGSRGLGFGVRQEPLVPAFAALGCQIVVTHQAIPQHGVSALATMDDSEIKELRHSESACYLEDSPRFEVTPTVPPTDHEQSDWLHGLNTKGLCPDAEFRRRVQARRLDLNSLNSDSDLNQFDFAWSACSLGHLSSLWLALRFVLNSVNCVKTGGWCIHTAEYLLDARAPDAGKTVFFTEVALQELIKCLQSLGHRVERLDWNLVNCLEDDGSGEELEELKKGSAPSRERVRPLFQQKSSVILIIQRGPVDVLYFPVDEVEGRKLMLCSRSGEICQSEGPEALVENGVSPLGTRDGSGIAEIRHSDCYFEAVPMADPVRVPTIVNVPSTVPEPIRPEKENYMTGVRSTTETPAPPIPTEIPKTRNVLLTFKHGLGDAVQFTTVLKHLQQFHPEWNVDVETLVGKHSAFTGLCRRTFSLDRSESSPFNDYQERYQIDWHECRDARNNLPSTKPTRCLEEVFHITPRLELCRYFLQVSDEAHSLAKRYLTSICPQGTKPDGRFPVVLIHYEGNTSADKKNLSHELIREVCDIVLNAHHVPVILDWDRRSPLPDGATIHCPAAGHELWRGHGTGDAEVLAALIDSSTLMIGIDSGPLHVAGATTTPTIGVWTKHHPVHFFDLADNVQHLVPHQHDELAAGGAAVEFFRQSYRHHGYHDLFVRLLALVEHQLTGMDLQLLMNKKMLRQLRATSYNASYYEEHKRAGLDYLFYCDWQENYGRWLVESLGLKGQRILDVGCACGSLLRGLSRAGARMEGVDLCEPMIQLGRQQWPDLASHLSVCDAVNLHLFANECFDGLHSSQVAEHWKPELVPIILRELARVTIPGGLFFCSFDTEELFARQGRSIETDDPTHVCIRPLSWWHEQLAANGWELCTAEWEPALRGHSGSYLPHHDWDWFVARRK